MHQNGKLQSPVTALPPVAHLMIAVTVLGIAESVFRLNPQSLFLELLPKGNKAHAYMHAHIHICVYMFP